MSDRPLPARERVREYLEAQCRMCRTRGTARLPTVAQLARATGVSPTTVQAAVRELVGRGVVRSRRGSGLFVAAAALRHERPAPSPRPAWRRAAARLEHDILSGAFRAGDPLPLRKELCVRYGVSHPTLAAAIDHLCARSLLVPQGRSLLVSSPQSSSAGGMVLVLRAGTYRDATLPDLRHLNDLLALESACGRAGLQAATVFYTYAGQRLVPDGPYRALLHSADAREGLLGFVVFTRGLAQLGVVEFVRELARDGLPVAVIDESGECLRDRTWGRFSHVRIFPLGFSVDAGRRTAELLLHLGHRRIAYLDPYAREHWSALRLEGLREAFANGGLEGGVEHARIDTDLLIPSTDAAGRGTADVLAELAEKLDTSDDLPGRLAAQLTIDRQQTLNEYLWSWMLEARIGEVIAPWVAELSRRPDITAVVCASDPVAVHCLTQLESAGVTVPRDKSIASFDNSYAAQVYGLTSYDFNGTAAVQAGIDFLLQPRWALLRDRSKRGVIEVAGFVRRRWTTGPCG
ncbi:MAG: GntR family transcriptional regulator [Chitinivibrionales bacterium]|nr:GntR family transcriptional regulator [Chitinivibrionales bacterium]